MVLRKVKARLLASMFVALAGGWAGVIAAGPATPSELFEGEFSWAHAPGEVRRVTDAEILHLPQQFGDFDLDATVELPEGGELDVVFRMMEPRLRPTADGSEQLVPFHARFSLLRLSAKQSGPPYRSREEALFADELVGGVKVGAGRPASVKIEARGRRVRAFVAGRWMPWVETTDDRGSIALVARGGTALLSYLKIMPQRRATDRPPWLPSSLLAALAGLVLMLSGRSPLRIAVALGIGLPAGAFASRELVFAHLLPSIMPSALALSLGSLCAVPLAISLAGPRRRWWLIATGAVLLPLLLEGAARIERPRLAPLEDARLSLYLGPDSCAAPFNALARRLRSKTRVHTVDGPPSRVLFLGGAALFEAQPDFASHVGLLTAAALQRKLGRKVEGIVVTTPLANSLQQLLLFRRFYSDLAPRVVVFGVSSLESATGEPWRARALHDQLSTGPLPERPLLLWQLLDPLAPGDQPVATPADLTRTLTELDQLCRDRGIALVLVTEPGTDPALVTVMQGFAASHGVPLVRDILDDTGAPRIEELVEVLAPRL